MTEENNRFDPDSDVTAALPEGRTASADDTGSALLERGITPLIPGTEIIGRRARRAARMAGTAEPSEEDQIPLWSASDALAAPSGEEPEESEDQIPLWEDSVLAEEAKVPFWEERAEPVTESAVMPAADGPSFLPSEDEAEAIPDPLRELFAPEEEIPLRRARTAVPDPVISEVEPTSDTEPPLRRARMPETEPVSSEEWPLPGEEIPSRRRRIAREESAVKKRPSAVSPLVEFVEIVVGALVAAILVLTLICRTGVVEGASMVPTMYNADRYVISDLFYSPEQGDIVVFRPEIDGEDELWIKRVIALEGQTVYIDPATYQVYVDGKRLDEPYLGGAGTIPHTTANPITVPEGCVYVLGDNRAISHDSRYEDLGCVEIGQLAGRVILRFWPLESFGFCE